MAPAEVNVGMRVHPTDRTLDFLAALSNLPVN